MPPRIPRSSLQSFVSYTSIPFSRQPFSASTRLQADDPFKGLQDILSPAKTRRPQQNPITSRAPSSALKSDFTNPSLLEIPRAAPLPSRTRPAGVNDSNWRDTNRPARSLFGRQAPESGSLGEPSGSDTGGDALISVVRGIERSGNLAERTRMEQARRAQGVQIRQIENQSSRTWRDGDVYSPHDLSPVEMQKARQARVGPRASNMPAANTRKKGGRDVLDDLGIDPLKEYKNFSMMSEFVTELGRIRHNRDTGLRAVNQRRMAKAVRRAIGIGIMPSVHRHPELMEERTTLNRTIRGTR